MNLDTQIQRVQNDLRAAGALGGPELGGAVDQLAIALGASLKLAMVEVLSEAADELSAELAPGSVSVSIVGGEPRFLVTLPGTPDVEPIVLPTIVESREDDEEQARMTLRITAVLKRRIEKAADNDGISANTWISRAIAASLDGAPSRKASASGRHVRGWAH